MSSEEVSLYEGPDLGDGISFQYTCVIRGSQIVFISMLSQPRKLSVPNMGTDSFSCLILQCCSLSSNDFTALQGMMTILLPLQLII